MNARCVKCPAPATHTNYKGIKDAEIVVGSDEYEALCANHWIEAQLKKDPNFLTKDVKTLKLKP